MSSFDALTKSDLASQTCSGCCCSCCESKCLVWKHTCTFCRCLISRILVGDSSAKRCTFAQGHLAWQWTVQNLRDPFFCSCNNLCMSCDKDYSTEVTLVEVNLTIGHTLQILRVLLAQTVPLRILSGSFNLSRNCEIFSSASDIYCHRNFGVAQQNFGRIPIMRWVDRKQRRPWTEWAKLCDVHKCRSGLRLFWI